MVSLPDKIIVMRLLTGRMAVVFHRVGLALNIFQVAEGSLNGENEEVADEAMESVEQEA